MLLRLVMADVVETPMSGALESAPCYQRGEYSSVE